MVQCHNATAYFLSCLFVISGCEKKRLREKERKWKSYARIAIDWVSMCNTCQVNSLSSCKIHFRPRLSPFHTAWIFSWKHYVTHKFVHHWKVSLFLTHTNTHTHTHVHTFTKMPQSFCPIADNKCVYMYNILWFMFAYFKRKALIGID